MLLAQALNRIEGDDDLGLKAVLIQNVLETLPQEEVLDLLPESCGSLKALATLGQETMASYLEKWQQVQAAGPGSKAQAYVFPTPALSVRSCGGGHGKACTQGQAARGRQTQRPG